jgi:pimeloyl-ACP methyl ester carboxylesterase
MPETWNLRRRVTLSGGEISYDVLGYGPPLILVHGTPSRSYIWRDVALRLADRITIYIFDLLGDSPQDVAAALFDFFTECDTRQ